MAELRACTAQNPDQCSEASDIAPLERVFTCQFREFDGVLARGFRAPYPKRGPGPEA